MLHATNSKISDLMSQLRFSLLFKNQHLQIPILRVLKVGGGVGGGPWSPGALKFLLWSLEPKDILREARSPAFSSLIIRVPRLH